MQKGILLGVLFTIFYVGCTSEVEIKNAKSEIQEVTVEKIDTVLKPTYDRFGIAIDSLEVEDHRIERNESLYVILDKFDFSAQEIYGITQEVSDLIDFRSVKPGQKYRTYFSADSTRELSQIVFQKNPVEFVVMDWQQDSLQLYEAARPMTRKLDAAAGTIDNSLYQTISEQGGSQLLANRMATIFAWQINFFGLRSGDSFKVLYDERFIGDEFYGVDEIKAAEFTHRGETFKAYKFTHEDVDGYFTDTGESVQRALLKAPFEYSQRVSSNFSQSRYHPTLKKNMPHHGVDYAAPPGTPVLAVGDGRVTEARYRGANGNIVKITHNSTYRTAYLHLRGFARGIQRGAKVEQGEVIGYVGSTGRATGPHLHYSLYKNDQPVNSRSIELPSSESVPDSLMDIFRETRDELDKKLEEKIESDARDEEKTPVFTELNN
ncbi:MAG: peptidoglycan DD-metalloendopeptidase family protein [Bacteroidota bacterium]